MAVTPQINITVELGDIENGDDLDATPVNGAFTEIVDAYNTHEHTSADISDLLTTVVPVHGTYADTGSVVLNTTVTGNTYPSFEIDADGTHHWGTGQAPLDTNLYRASAGVVKTDGQFASLGTGTDIGFKYNPSTGTGNAFYSVISVDANPVFAIQYSGKTAWGPGGVQSTDTFLYRNGVGILKTDGSLQVGGDLLLTGATSHYFATSQTSGTNIFKTQVSGDLNFRLQITNTAVFQWGDGTNAPDITLARNAPGILQLGTATQNGQLIIVQTTTTGPTLSARVTNDLNDRFHVLANGIIQWGSGALPPDTNLYRANVGILKTDNILNAVGGLRAEGMATTTSVAFATDVTVDTVDRFQIDATGKMQWGTGALSQDTVLFRDSVNSLRTTGLLNSLLGSSSGNSFAAGVSGDANYRFNVTAAGVLSWGDGTGIRDVVLTRAGVGQLTLGSATGAGRFNIQNSVAGSTIIGSFVGSEVNARFAVDTSGILSWGAGSGASDVFLSRLSAAILSLQGSIKIASSQSTDQAYGLILNASNTTATAGSVYGVNSTTVAANATGTMAGTYGGSFFAQYQGVQSAQANNAATALVGIHARSQISGPSPVGTITTSYGFLADAVAHFATGSPAVTISTAIGVRIIKQKINDGVNGLTITNSDAIRIDDQGSSSTVNALNVLGGNSRHAGNFAFGGTATTPLSPIHLVSDAGTAAVGIKFGSAGDTSLYRSAAKTLSVDGSFRSTENGAGNGFIYAPATATGNALVSTVGVEANSRFAIDYSGLIRWGAGGASASDASLSRSGANTLAMGGTALAVRLNIYQSSLTNSILAGYVTTDTNPRFSILASGSLGWGPGTTTIDTSLSRTNIAELTTNGLLKSIVVSISSLAFASAVGSDVATRFAVRGDGQISWGDGTNAKDTTLYRSAADRLATDDLFSSISLGLATKVKAGTPADGDWTAAPPDGTLVVDSSANKIWARVGGVWKSAALT